MDISGSQILAAIGLSNTTRDDLVKAKVLSANALRSVIQGEAVPRGSTIEKIIAYFDDLNIEFIEDGVRKKPQGRIRVLEGQAGFNEFMDDVYHTVRIEGGNIDVANVNEANWLKWMGEDYYKVHENRMSALDNYTLRILVEEGDDNLIAGYGEYRAIPHEYFNEQSFYAYGSKLAIIAFEDTSVTVTIIDNANVGEGFISFFTFAWDNARKI